MTRGPSPGPRRITPTALWAAAIVAAILAIHLPSLGNRPVFDDQYLASGELFAEFATTLELRARMLSYGSFVWIRDLFGEGWWKQRLVNVALHVAVVGSLWFMYREIARHIASPPAAAGEAADGDYRDSPAMLVAIAFFALNPVAVYAVDYLIQRSIVMATLFVVLSLGLFAKGVAERRPGLLALAFASYLLAVASKEHAILAPLAAVPVYIVVARPSMRRLAGLAAAGAVAMAAIGAALATQLGSILATPFDEFSRIYVAQLEALAPGAAARAYPLSVLNQAWLFFEYGVRWFIPVAAWMSINLRPPFPVSFATLPHLLGAVGYVAVVAGGFWLVARHRDWRALAGLSLLLPALLFATEFATVWVQDPFVLYRSYLWAIGVPGLVLVALHGTPPRVLAASALVVFGLFAWQGLDRVFSLATPVAAWSDAIRALPDDPRAVGRWFPYLNRGSAYVENREYNLAMRDFEVSASLGDRGLGTFNRGSLFAANGEHPKALASFAAAEQQGYDLYNLPFQRALSLLALNRPAEALGELKRARFMDPPSPTRELLLWHLGRTAMQVGDAREAQRALGELVTLQPANRDALHLLSVAHIALEENADALGVLDNLRLQEDSPRVRLSRAIALHGLGRKREALDDLDEAVRKGGDSPQLQQWRGRIEAMK